jgi:uncharacterized protein (DUF1800 family)
MHDNQACTPVEPIHTEATPAKSAPPSGSLASSAAAATLAAGASLISPEAAAASLPAPSAARFLAQATMGASRADIAHVQLLGFNSWLDEQMRMPRGISHWDWLVAKGYTAANLNFNTAGFDASMWRQLISAPDQLRQRVGMALLDMLVISVADMRVAWPSFAAAAYVDILLDNAFGNYRTLLEKVSTSVAMGQYLTFTGNRKANPARGTQPDENYARELMQLITLGLNKLHDDGTPITFNGRPVDSYVQDDVSGLARVFTGFVIDSADTTIPDRLRRPLVQNATLYETGAKTFLGTTIPAGAGAFAGLRTALDTLFAHPNVPPFVSKQLIKRLVTSNPSRTYVKRVAAVFRDNGYGVRGDLAAVIRAILLNSEARGDARALSFPTFGKLRAPVNRLTAWARGFGAASPADAWNIGDTSSPATRLGQSTGRSPSVFNFFRPGYTPPNTEIAAQGLVGPEFQITSETSTTGYVNYMIGLVRNGTGDVKPDYLPLLALVNTPQALVDEVNLILAAGQISAATLATIRGAVESISPATAAGRNNRVYTAILLVMAAPEFIAQK